MSETKEMAEPIGVLPNIDFNVRQEVVLSAKALATIKYAHKATKAGEVPLGVFERWIRTAMQSALAEGNTLAQRESEAE